MFAIPARHADASATGAITVDAPAKINLHLGVYPGRDARGYHRADSVMVAVDLFDQVRVTPAHTPSVTCSPAVSVAPERTAVWRAVVGVAEALHKRPLVAVHVERGIPSQGGLGSASTDAAAAIRACCRLWGADAEGPEMVAIARSIGADVAFFLNPVPSLMVGAGDVLAESLSPLCMPIALVRPDVGVSTPAAFAAFDRAPVMPQPARAMTKALAAGSREVVAETLYNNLEGAASQLVPEIAEVAGWLRGEPGVLGAQMTGSGSCVFAICESEGAAHAIATDAAGRGWWARACTTVGPDDTMSLRLATVGR